MKKPFTVVRRLGTSRYQLSLSQAEAEELGQALYAFQQAQPKASSYSPHFAEVLLTGVLRRLYHRVVVRLASAPPAGLRLALTLDELAAVGSLAGAVQHLPQWALLGQVFGPIHQILS